MPALPITSSPGLVGLHQGSRAADWLRRSVVAWTSVVLLGQLIFATCVLVFYGGSVLAGEPSRWNQVLPAG